MLKMPKDIIEHLDEHSINYKEIELKDMRKKIRDEVDFCYAVRTQAERHIEKHKKELQMYLYKYGDLRINKEFTKRFLKTKGKVYHPLPRKNEIPEYDPDVPETWEESIDTTPQNGFSKQMEAGVFTSMALLKLQLSPSTNLKKLL